MNYQNEASAWIERSEADCAVRFAQIDRVALNNQRKVLSAFQNHRIAVRHFAPTMGYGYDDIGRDALDRVFADVLGAEVALIRPQIASGTHALGLCLQGILRPGDVLLSITGKPYDTMDEVIGLEGERGSGSLRDYSIDYEQVDLTEEGLISIDEVLSRLSERVKIVYIQRSRGYAWRKSLSIDDIRSAAQAVHAVMPEVCVMVDNCYGEFTDLEEPLHAGADLIAGSMIKNIGGGIAPTGGYIAGRAALIAQIANRFTTPGIGAEVGSYAYGYQPFYQGLFMAPHVVAQALKTAVLAARAFELAGFQVSPRWDEARSDIIQAIRLQNPEPLIAFCRAVQRNSPIDSEVVPEPWAMPGYQNEVIMAAGTFVAGASIELSADAPIRPPYTVYLQGALTYEHGRICIEEILSTLLRDGWISMSAQE